MKKFKFAYLLLAIIALAFTSCDETDPILDNPKSDVTGLYFLNYGSSNSSSTITKYNNVDSTTINNYYEGQNSTILTSKGQYFYEYNNKIYIMGNGADQVIVLDSTFVQSENGISEGIIKPRYCIGNENYLYISCWGGEVWSDNSLSYIAKLNINSNTVEEKIALPGGTEGLEIANGKLFVALNYSDSIAAIDLVTEAISYIETPAVSSYFVKDADENLYVSMISTYYDYSETTGLGLVNTTTNAIDTVYALGGISSEYSSILTANTDASKFYILASSWVKIDDKSIQQGAIYSFDTKTKEYTPFLENLTGINGMTVNPADNNIYVFGADSYTEPGFVKIYDAEANYISEFGCGVSPYWGLYLNYDNE